MKEERKQQVRHKKNLSLRNIKIILFCSPVISSSLLMKIFRKQSDYFL